MSREEKIVHKTKEEIEAEVEVDFDTFFKEKKFNENSPLQYTNSVAIIELARMAGEEAKGKVFEPKAFTGKATVMFQVNYPEYRKVLESAGWTYEG